MSWARSNTPRRHPSSAARWRAFPIERARIAFLAGELERHAGDGTPVGRIVIPTGRRELRRRQRHRHRRPQERTGHLPGNAAFPGSPARPRSRGTARPIWPPSATSTTSSRATTSLLSMPYAHFTYTVTGQRVVAPTDVAAAVANVGYTRLVLSACTPLFSAEKRLLVYARLTRTVPVGAARVLPGGAIPRPIEALRVHTRRRYQRCSNPSIRTASPRSSESVAPGVPAATSPIQLTCTSPSSATRRLHALAVARGGAEAQLVVFAASRRQLPGGHAELGRDLARRPRRAAARRARCARRRRSRGRDGRRRSRGRRRGRSSRARRPPPARGPRAAAAAGAARAPAAASACGRVPSASFQHREPGARAAEARRSRRRGRPAWRRRGRRAARGRLPSRQRSPTPSAPAP